MSATRTLALGLLMFAGPAESATVACPPLELVLAVDVSNSVDRDEFKLQVGGIAAAFRDEDVASAIRSAGGIGVSVVFWADPAYSADVIERVEIRSSADGEQFARRVERARRRLTGNTGLGSGLWTALDLLDHPTACGQRKVVDVSGDGRDSNHRPASGPLRRASINPAAARSRAERSGVTVNALAILNDEPDLTDYYARTVLTGPGAFVMAASGYPDFAAAMRIKLLREIEPLVGQLGRETPSSPTKAELTTRTPRRLR